MYKLDPEAARGADQSGNRIAEKGKYKGRFTRAQHTVSEAKGTQGIDFDFVADGGQKARFTIYTTKADGTRIYGYKQLMAMMTCLEVRELSDPKNLPCKTYDFDAKADVDKVVPQFAELLGKPVGLLVTMEEYKAGKWRPNLAGLFQASTELVASEILDRKTQPMRLAQMVQSLRDKPLAAGAESAGSAPAGNGAGYFDPADDDIPF